MRSTVGVVVRPLRDPVEFQLAVEVQRDAWRMPDYREAAPAHLLRALADNGGLVLGAFIEGELVGVSYGWFVGEPGSGYFYSHATGVREGVKYRGVGFALKVEQRRRVLDRGYGLAKWTFDPLQSLNTRFNLGKLGVIVREYLVNYYGEIRDSINIGLGSDRARAEWLLDSERVRLKLEGRLNPAGFDEILGAGGAVVLERLQGPGGLEAPGTPRLGLDAPALLVALPASVSSLRDRDPGLARRWRLATREVYSHYLASGYMMVDYVRGPGGGYVVLARDPMEPAVYQSPA